MQIDTCVYHLIDGLLGLYIGFGSWRINFLDPVLYDS